MKYLFQGVALTLSIALASGMPSFGMEIQQKNSLNYLSDIHTGLPDELLMLLFDYVVRDAETPHIVCKRLAILGLVSKRLHDLITGTYFPLISDAMVAKNLLSRFGIGVDDASPLKGRKTLLHMAASQAMPNICGALLAIGADPLKGDALEITPLHFMRHPLFTFGNQDIEKALRDYKDASLEKVELLSSNALFYKFINSDITNIEEELKTLVACQNKFMLKKEFVLEDFSFLYYNKKFILSWLLYKDFNPNITPVLLNSLCTAIIKLFGKKECKEKLIEALCSSVKLDHAALFIMIIDKINEISNLQEDQDIKIPFAELCQRALFYKALNIIQVLSSANLSQPDEQDEFRPKGYFPLSQACRIPHSTDIIGKLLKKGFDINQTHTEEVIDDLDNILEIQLKKTPLLCALEYRLEDNACFLIQEGAHINAYSTVIIDNGERVRETPLRLAIEQGLDNIAKIIISQKGDLDQRCYFNRMVIHYYAWLCVLNEDDLKNFGVAPLELPSVPLEFRNNFGFRSFILAIKEKDFPINYANEEQKHMSYLSRLPRANVLVEDTALTTALRLKNEAIAIALLDEGANPNICQRLTVQNITKEWSPLRISLLQKLYSITKKLLTKKASFFAENKRPHTFDNSIIKYAIDSGAPYDLIDLLLDQYRLINLDFYAQAYKMLLAKNADFCRQIIKRLISLSEWELISTICRKVSPDSWSDTCTDREYHESGKRLRYNSMVELLKHYEEDPNHGFNNNTLCHACFKFIAKDQAEEHFKTHSK